MFSLIALALLFATPPETVQHRAETFHYGAPFSVTMEADGRRVFRWEMRSEIAFPSRSPAFATDAIYAGPETGALPPVPTDKPPVCVLTIWGRWDGGSQAWLIDQIKKPDITCID